MAATTRRKYAITISFLRTFFVERLRDPKVNRIRAPHVRRYLAWRRRTHGIGARSIEKDRVTLSGIFTFAVKELEVMEHNAAKNVKPAKADPGTYVILADEQFERLLDACETDALGYERPSTPRCASFA